MPLQAYRLGQIELRFGEELSLAEGARVTLELQVKPAEVRPDNILVLFGSTPLEKPGRAASWLRYRVEPAAVRKGLNTITLSIREEGDQAVTVQDVLLRVGPRKTPATPPPPPKKP
jgi:hypothetical protein